MHVCASDGLRGGRLPYHQQGLLRILELGSKHDRKGTYEKQHVGVSSEKENGTAIERDGRSLTGRQSLHEHDRNRYLPLENKENQKREIIHQDLRLTRWLGLERWGRRPSKLKLRKAQLCNIEARGKENLADLVRPPAWLAALLIVSISHDRVESSELRLIRIFSAPTWQVRRFHHPKNPSHFHSNRICCLRKFRL